MPRLDPAIAADNDPHERMMKTRSLVVLIVALATIAGAAGLLILPHAPVLVPWTLDPARQSVTLEDVEQEVIRRYQVPDIVPARLAEQIASGSVVLFDVRTKDEFDTGHLEGAIQLDPTETTDAFMARYGPMLENRSVVFYCSVGVRSSQFLQRVRPLLNSGTRGKSLNLRGGAFRWVSEGHPLVAANRAATLHPFDENWEKLLTRTLQK
jgi:rhodanese-related sulfurtransferase